MNCRHRELKKNWPFGVNSVPLMKCLRCGEAVKPHDLMVIRKDEERRRKKWD